MITIALDDAALKRWMSLAGSEFRRAAVMGINRTAEDGLAAGRAAIQSHFTVRAPNFILPPVQLPREWRASERNGITATLAIGDGGARKMGERRRNILEPFEQGKPKLAHSMPVFIPTKVIRPSNASLVNPKLYPTNLLGVYDQVNSPGRAIGLKRGRAAYGGRRRKVLDIRDFHQYFVIDNASNPKANGIYERFGPKPNQVRMIWAARPSVKRPALLQWEATMRRVIAERLEPNMIGAINLALQQLARQQAAAAAKAISSFVGALT